MLKKIIEDFWLMALLLLVCFCVELLVAKTALAVFNPSKSLDIRPIAGVNLLSLGLFIIVESFQNLSESIKETLQKIDQQETGDEE